MNRRRMMFVTGVGALAFAAIPVPQAGAHPSRPDLPTDRVPPPASPEDGVYLFEDEFDGEAGSAPDPSKWRISRARETMKDPTFWELPENVGQYRDDRRNVFLDGDSNLVIKAFKEGNTYFGGKVFSSWEGGINTVWESRIKLDCLTPGAWPAWWLSSDAQGEIDILEWYGNGKWASGTTVHTQANGGQHSSHTLAIDSAWHTWRVQWDDGGMKFWQDYSDGAEPYFTVPANSIPNWPFNNPGYKVFPIFNLAVAGSGGGDPSGGTYPAEMLVDYIRVWQA